MATLPLAVRNLDRDTRLAEQVQVADRWWSRARGLLGRTLREGEGLLIRPCRAVHMLGMTYPIDVLFLDADHRVVAIYPGLRPARTTRYHRGAEMALELPAGVAGSTGTRIGDRLLATPNHG
jgi:hypothetical protein